MDEYTASVKQHRAFIKQEMLEKYNGQASILDIGTFWGVDSSKFRDCYSFMDGVEIYKPFIKMCLDKGYRKMYNVLAQEFAPEEYYDVILMFSVIEHMTAEDARKAIETMAPYCTDMYIDIPFCRENHRAKFDSNPYQVHLQADLTPENMLERYPMLTPILLDEHRGLYKLK